MLIVVVERMLQLVCSAALCCQYLCWSHAVGVDSVRYLPLDHY